MTTVLVAIDDGPTAEGLLRTARTWSSVLDTALWAVHVREGDQTGARDAASRVGVPLQELDGDPATVVLELSRHRGVDLVVIGARQQMDGARPAGHIAVAVAEHAGVPVLVVPPEWVTALDAHVRKVLAPLEGSTVSSVSTGPLLRRLAGAGVGIVALHVYTPTDLPMFADHAPHAEEALAASFAGRWCTEAAAEVRLRVGNDADVVVDAADIEQPDAIALAWSQDLSPGHARVVRAALERSRRPVLLVPQPDDRSH